MSLAKALQAAAGNAGEALYVDDVMSTYLYTGNGSTQTITNGIDLAGEGGMVWLKSRSISGTGHNVWDSARGVNNALYPNLTNAQASFPGYVSFNSNGFNIGTNDAWLNQSAATYASWTFRKQAKFFDVVTYTGNGVAGRTVSHNLGSTPGCMIVKNTSNGTVNWAVYHRSVGNTGALYLNTTNATDTWSAYWNNTTPTSANFTLGNSTETNANGATYVAYLFAHDAGGFGDGGSENVISCGSYTGNGSATGPTVTLGYEPQWLLIKQSSASGQWWNLIDVMRGFNVSTGAKTLGANASDAEYSNAGFGDGTPIVSPTSTGFQVRSAQPATNASGATYIYIAIRRPMKPPESGTEVFAIAQNTSSPFSMTAGFPVDSWWYGDKAGTNKWFDFDRLRGNNYLKQNTTDAEVAFTVLFDSMTTVALTSSNATGYIQYAFKRASGFMDVVCYTGTGSATTVSHNLGAVPELMIFKRRSVTGPWIVMINTTSSAVTYLQLESTIAQQTDGAGVMNSTLPTASVFTVGTSSASNQNGIPIVCYLFASLPGISKVGSYTGNGSSQTINCGFTSGARFVLIKRTDSTGSWWTFDSARGIVAGNDPALQLNSTAAEVTSADAVDADSTGFVVNQEATCNLNVNAASYIFLSIS